MECTAAFSCNCTTHRPFTRTWARRYTWSSWPFNFPPLPRRGEILDRTVLDCAYRVPCELLRRAPPSAVNTAAPVETWRKRRSAIQRPSGSSRGRGRHATTRTHAWHRENAARTATRVARDTLSSPFSMRAIGACLVCRVCLWNVNFSYLNCGQCCGQKFPCPRHARQMKKIPKSYFCV